MLKWTNSAQKSMTQDCESGAMEKVCTPHIKNRLRRRTTICQINKENLVPKTSTPFATRLNKLHTKSTPSPTINSRTSRRSTHAETLSHLPKYASTLPRFEEEYSPSATIPSGRELALRGLLPDVFVGNQRYFQSPLLEPPKPKSPFTTPKLPKCKTKFERPFETPCKDSAKMTDNSLDKLIDAILDSACKTEKKKKTRKSLNLRRRTLLKTHEEDVKELSLSPSYAAGDDPASDLSFLLVEPTNARRISNTPTAVAANNLPPTPLPHTPVLNKAIPKELLLRMPTPPNNNSSILTSAIFQLETPMRTTRKRRVQADQDVDIKTAKNYKRQKMNYLEVGLALPSIYV